MILFKLTPNRITALTLACIAALFFLGMGILFIVNKITKKKHTIRDNRLMNYEQAFSYDFKNKIFKCVNTKCFQKPITVTTNDFLKNFLLHNHEGIITWLNKFIEFPVEDTINGERRSYVVDYVLSKNKKDTKYRICKAVLICTNVNLENQLINFELELMKHTRSTYSKNRTIKQFVYPVETIRKRYEDGKFSKGCFICIDLHSKSNTAAVCNDTLVKSLIIDQIYKITTPNETKICYKGEYKRICLLETRSVNRFDLTKYVQAIRRLINDLLMSRGYDVYYDYYIVASLTSDLTRYFDESYTKVEKLFSIDLNYDRNFSIYQQARNEHFKVEESYKNELSRIIRNQQLDVAFRPIIHIANKRIVSSGYMSFVMPNNTLFKDVEELRKIAAMYDKDKEIFSLILRKIIPIFTGEKDNTQQKLSLSMTIREIPYAIRSLPHFSEVEKSSIILCFNSKELIDIEDDDNKMRNLRSLKDKGYELGLFTSKDDYVLKDKTYSLFRYFFFDSKFESNVKSNSLSFLKAHQFLERLIKYHGIIVCYNATNLQGVDFLVKSGIEYFSADCISPKSNQLLPIDKKISKKLLNMNK